MTQHTALEQAAQWLKDADGIVVCAANGLSMAAGFAILRSGSRFDSRFSDFVQKYGIRTPLQGLQTSFPRPEEFSRFYSRLLTGSTMTSRFRLSCARCAPSAACTRPLC